VAFRNTVWERVRERQGTWLKTGFNQKNFLQRCNYIIQYAPHLVSKKLRDMRQVQ
jgi:hypothetical protein